MNKKHFHISNCLMRDSDDMNICADSRQNKQSDFIFHFCCGCAHIKSYGWFTRQFGNRVLRYLFKSPSIGRQKCTKVHMWSTVFAGFGVLRIPMLVEY